MSLDKLNTPKAGAIPVVKRQPPLRPQLAKAVVQAKTINGPQAKTHSASQLSNSPARAFRPNTIQGYYGDDWEPGGWPATFRGRAQAAIGAEWVRARGYGKGPASARVAVSRANTFAAYAVLIYRSDNNVSTRITFGSRLSGNPSNAGGRMYADHSVRVTNYNVDCAEYYLIKQARRALPAILYRAGYDPRPSLYVYSDHSPCPKCQEDFDKLQEEFGDLELVIMYERRYMAHQDDDRWDIPGADMQRVVGLVAPEDQTDISGHERPSVEDEADGWTTVVK